MNGYRESSYFEKDNEHDYVGLVIGHATISQVTDFEGVDALQYLLSHLYFP